MTPTTRFSDRAQLYVKYRPGYPPGVIDALKHDAGLSSASIVADIVSGTGISTRLLAPHVRRIYAVEPNAEMRAEAEREQPLNVISVNGTAEATTLPDASVHFVMAATAFHWFKTDETRAEFHRILKAGGLVVLMWNMRKRDSSPLGEAYNKLLVEFGTDYKPALMSDKWNAPAEEFFGAGKFEHRTMPNHQDFDFEGFKGRLLSASYAPLPGHDKYEPMILRLREIYERFEVDGEVRFDYDTQLYWGRI
jgi:SAM-dependent methyltransferase